MSQAAVVVLAGTDSSGDLGRVVNALETAREFQQSNGDLELIFDGAGTQWIPELEDEDSNYHELYRDVKEDATACSYCAGAFDVEGDVTDAGVELVDEQDGHPSIQSLVDEGYEVITF